MIVLYNKLYTKLSERVQVFPTTYLTNQVAKSLLTLSAYKKAVNINKKSGYIMMGRRSGK